MTNRHPDLRGKNALVWELDENLTGDMETPVRPHLIPLRRSKPSDVYGVANVVDHVNEYFQALKQLSPSDAEQITSALQFHRIALQANSEEARFVNLWIAIETLCRRSQSSTSIITTVCDQVVPSVAGGNIRNVLTSLATYLHRFQWHFRKDFCQIFQNSSHEHLSISDIRDVLQSEQESEEIEELYKQISINPLLCFRIYHERQIFKDRKAVAKMLTQHRQNVDWQLRRIYRARNDIMHRGETSLLLPRLIQHLHSYLVMTIHNLVFDLKLNPEWSISDAFTHRQIVFEQLIGVLEGQGTVPSVILIDPAAVLKANVPPFSWKESTKAGSVATINNSTAGN